MMFRLPCALPAPWCGVAVAAAHAKPLVFSAEGGPDGFDPCLRGSGKLDRERPWHTMVHSAVYGPIRRDVAGFVMSASGSVDFEGGWRA